ncbi:MAG TPA: hypothetical protein VK957_04395, partial [Lunatimonas sp.]|nr:hypothetical protein [Lunatimonas sp.]
MLHPYLSKGKFYLLSPQAYPEPHRSDFNLISQTIFQLYFGRQAIFLPFFAKGIFHEVYFNHISPQAYFNLISPQHIHHNKVCFHIISDVRPYFYYISPKAYINIIS